MASFQSLSTELLDHVFFQLETRQDLLHIALTCKTFYEIIVSTDHLRIASISCSFDHRNRDKHSIFWQRLSSSPRSCSMIRELEIFKKVLFRVRAASNMIQQFRGLRIDGTNYSNLKFLKNFDSDWHPQHCTPSDFGILLRCLDKFHSCQSVTVYEVLSRKELNNLLAHMPHLSNILQTLVINVPIHDTEESDSDTFAPRSLSSCSFNRMRTFHLDLKFLGDSTCEKNISLMLDSLVFSCSTLVDFALSVPYFGHIFEYFPLMKHANWPSLKKLKLGRWLKLFDPYENGHDIYISFFERHSRIECLHLELNSSREPFQTELPPHVLPQLRSLSTNFQIHPGILPRLHHISNLEVFESNTYSLTTSLRSCVLDVTSSRRNGIIPAVVEAIPHLERLCLIMELCVEYCQTKECICIFSRNPNEIRKARNLTHLGFVAYDMSPTVINDLLSDLLQHLPKLSRVYMMGERDAPVQYEVVEDSRGYHEFIRSKDPVDPDWIDYFFNRMIIDLLDS